MLKRTDGQTLIEMIVVLVLITVIGGMAFTFLADSFATQETTRENRRVLSLATNAVEQLGSDLRQAYAPGRGPSQVTDLDTLRKGVIRDGAISNPSGVTLDVRDIVVAAPERLMFRADVLSSDINPGVECVEYAVVGGWLTKVVYANINNPALTTCAASPPVTLVARKRIVPPRTP